MCRVWTFLDVLYRAGRRWRLGFDDDEWWSGREGCYPMKEMHVVEEKRRKN
jgi:hypothetical protein